MYKFNSNIKSNTLKKMYKFNSNILIDKSTKEKCCLFNNSILQIKNNEMITINIPEKNIDIIPDKIFMNASSFPSKNININELKDWGKKIEKVEIKKGIWIIIGKYCDWNAGHVLGDEVYAVWRTLTAFGLQNSNFNIITNNKGNHLKQYKCITNNKLYHFKDFKNKEVLFETLIFGMSRNGYSNCYSNVSYLPPITETFESFRTHTYKLFNIKEDKNRSIIILDKNAATSDHKCKLYDIDMIIELLKDKYTSHNIKKINWYGMKMEDQVKEMSLADIVISLPGSDLMNCIFLNPKSSIIYPYRFINTRSTEGSNEIGLWFRHTHNCIEISDVSSVYVDSQLYSKLNDPNILLKHIDECLNKMESV